MVPGNVHTGLYQLYQITIHDHSEHVDFSKNCMCKGEKHEQYTADKEIDVHDKPPDGCGYLIEIIHLHRCLVKPFFLIKAVLLGVHITFHYTEKCSFGVCALGKVTNPWNGALGLHDFSSSFYYVLKGVIN